MRLGLTILKTRRKRPPEEEEEEEEEKAGPAGALAVSVVCTVTVADHWHWRYTVGHWPIVHSGARWLRSNQDGRSSESVPSPEEACTGKFQTSSDSDARRLRV